MQRYFDYYRDQAGNGISGATVTVYQAGTSTPATIYEPDSNATPLSAKANPFTTDANGYWAFAAANGAYAIRIEGAGSSTMNVPYVALFDSAGSSTGGGGAAGAANQIQYNVGGGVFGASANFTFNPGTNTFTVTGPAVVGDTTLNGSITFSANRGLAAGTITASATNGLVVQGKTGSSYDLALVSAASSYVLRNPTGTARVEIPDTTASTSTTTGALVVSGGVGVAGKINAGGNLGVDGGSVTVGTNAGATGAVAVNVAAGNNRGYQYLTAGTLRWYWLATSVAESGSDAGTGIALNAYTDAGVSIDSPISITRASGGSITLGGSTNRAVIINGTAGLNAQVYALSAAAGTVRPYYFQTSGSLRWRMAANGVAESGSDAGSNWSLDAYTDAGALIDTPISITRASGGTITIGGSTNRPVTFSGTGTFSGNVTIAKSATNMLLTIGDGSATSSGSINLRGNNTQTAWQIGSNQFTVNGLDFTPSTAGGGTTFTTPTMNLTSSALSVAADVKVSTAGKGLFVKEGSNAKMGTATLVAGAATVSTTAVSASSRIFVTSNADGGTPGWLRVSARVAGTSFTITSSSGTDTSTVAWIIVDPA